ncbi:SRPBCC family protein [Flavobacteriaceae bacterium S356]|uniref:SRPBCC family protein n=1 Tax=Asprobacillus argus TaxID=3076534 RepID=A0ABU3LF21_9FLAO|nr:SRPBCC family protein [Flavobacteriaceae bacterium S356]
MNFSITIKDTIRINADRETVWNFTQDPSLRSVWDRTVTKCELQQKRPQKVLRLKMLGGILTDLTYKLCRKPIKTSLKLTETRSWLFKGGGGSWKYHEFDGHTEWVQTNTLVFRHRLMYWLFSKPIYLILEKMTARSMRDAKKLIENN